MNDDATLREIEDALEGVDGLDWIRVEDPGLVTARGSPRRLYRLTLTPDALACPDVHHLELAVPLQFPYEPPAVYAPGAGTTVPWPHVEPDDRLCPIASRFDVDAATRVLEILQWAVNLLNQDEQMRRSEFDREFLSYWPCRPSGLHVLSLVTLDAPSRTVSWCIDAGTGRFVMADDEGALRRWMARADRGLRANAVHDGAYVRLIELPEPGTYPETGARLEEMIRTSGAPLPPLHVGARVPVVLGAPTATGTLAVAAVVEHGGARVTTGFRHRERKRATRALWTSAANRPVSRRTVERMDGSWIHGRDNDPDHDSLRVRSVGVVGCGSLGSSAVRLLAQAGVGRFVFVDPDVLMAENLSRHALDHPFLGTRKADAMHRWFERAFPHADGAQAFTKRWERLDDDELEILSGGRPAAHRRAGGRDRAARGSLASISRRSAGPSVHVGRALRPGGSRRRPARPGRALPGVARRRQRPVRDHALAGERTDRDRGGWVRIDVPASRGRDAAAHRGPVRRARPGHPLRTRHRVPAARMARLGRRHPQTGRAADRPGTRGRRRAGRGMAMSPAPPPVFGARAPAPGIDQCLLFADRVVARFERHRQRGAPDLEAGGQLFGTVDDRAVRLIDASGPGSGDERGRTHFRSCPVRAQRAIERRARRGLLYLGEWHTHPEVVPRPSPQDRLAMSSLLRDSRPNTDPLLMVIVGRQPGTGGWHVESCDRWNNRLVWEATLSG